MEASANFSQQTRAILEVVGWRPGRVVSTTRWEVELAGDGFPALHPVARRFLAEFGGLAVPHGGPGVTCAREPVSFTPTDCSGEADRFIAWSERVGRVIAPIGEVAGDTCGMAWLGIDEHEEVYLVVNRLASFGRLPVAMDHLVLGYMPDEID
ncbi:hypothetical protein GCM10010112_66180 [Actinoplanes lobatus]|uniref:SUKH-3 immunity protein of toxin-antitoxin system n=1 Tax=Actinoplanes lobatus TaxID=113568 RepID=A0A7W7MIT4_9ACTN|nr:SUKH-3 domain-containing protein [Actinoplanes lobatus]MBB4751907.1 hypothetical protein [Actinoplanes lobatus]GGN85592.1 hypothetical protein GCM10010112_66180 [Actinoplanes lobatus]GIE44367.1 hypothetical protein Alo02nite_72650 [Actinoplanes lobatus]